MTDLNTQFADQLSTIDTASLPAETCKVLIGFETRDDDGKL